MSQSGFSSAVSFQSITRKHLNAMRTLFLLTFAFFFIAEGAVAQNNQSNVTQNGQNNDATIEQDHSGSEGMNVVTVKQLRGPDGGGDNTVEEFSQWGSGNEATITQTGWEHVVRQWSDQGAKKHGLTGKSFQGEIEIIQRGSQNLIHDVDQIGWKNKVDILQEGEENFIDIETQYSERGGSGNSVEIGQGLYGRHSVGDGSGDRGIHQQGNNELTIYQNVSDSRAGVKTLREAGITDFGPNPLIGSGEQSGENQAIVQAGSDNSLEIQQEYDDEVEFALQNGIGNEGTILQRDRFDGGNTASLIQRGSDHTTEITQKNGSNQTSRVTQDGTSQTATLMQDGNGHTALVTQSGMGHIATLTQEGSDHTATVTQSGTLSSTATVTQNGTGHTATVTQQ